MKTTSIDRFMTMGTVCIAAAACLSAQAQTNNSWTGAGSGNWEDLTWSLGIRPGAGQNIFITNANWKAVELTHSTAVNFPGSMTVNSITLDAPPGTENTLLLNYVGVSTPLTAGFMHTKSNTVVTLLSSELNVTFDMFEMNGTFNQGAFSGVNAKWLIIGDDGPGVYNLTNGTLTVTGVAELLGPPAGFPSVFNQEGGYHYAVPLTIGYRGTYLLHGGQLGGIVTMDGGVLNQSGGDLSPDSLSVQHAGSVVQSSGTGTMGSISVGEMSSNNNPPSYYTLSNAVVTCTSNLTVNSLGIFRQEGGTNTVNGTVSVLSADYQGHLVQGEFALNKGMLSAGNVLIGGGFDQGGGTNRVFGNVTITGDSYSRYSLSGGLLMSSNTIMNDGEGNFIQSGGRHLVANTLHVTGGAEPAYGMSGGQVVAPTIDILYGTFSHNGGTVTNTGLLRLGGWWEEFAGNQQFGQLQIDAADGSLWLGTNTAVLRFADSSARTWGSGTLHIRNWTGSLNGGGSNQVIFGNSSAALTPAQVAQIRFDWFPSTQYPAKILPTGEVVPNPTGPPYDPNGLSAQGVSANQINLTWTDNSLDETGFKIERSPDGTNFVQIATVGTNTTTYADTGLVPMTAYFYRVRAYNGHGDSGYTAVAEASTRFNGAPPLPGMIAWWPGENSPDDVIGNHNGTTPYGIAYAPGKSGQAFDFDASNRRVFIPDNPDFVVTNLTFEGWFYARQTLDAYIGMRGDDRGALDSWVVRRLSDGQLSFQIGDMSLNFVVIETPVQNNQWYHFAATFDGASGSMKLYINGALAVQTNTALQLIGAYDPGWNPGIGIGSQSGTITVRPSFDGLIDDIALYSRALSPAEIQSIYNAGAAGKAGLAQANASPLLSLQPQSGGTMQLTISGVAGRNYEVEVSPDLLNWLSWTQVNSTGTNSVIDASPDGHPQRFYRARVLP